MSTHGYSQNQILVWKYPSLTQVTLSFTLDPSLFTGLVQVAKLTGHSYRVLYLAMSPDGESIVTGAGDETLRFWNVFRLVGGIAILSLLMFGSYFSKARSQKESKSALNLFTSIR